MSLILCLETATEVCSVSLAGTKGILSMRELKAGFGHAEKLTVFISEVMEEAGKKLNEIDAIAVSSGPGSYTGLRIGVSVAKGLCYALDKPLISLPTLSSLTVAAIERSQPANQELFCPMIDARRMEVYYALYDRELFLIKEAQAQVVDENFIFSSSIAKRIYYFGDGASKCSNMLKDAPTYFFIEDIHASSAHMHKSAFKKFDAKDFENLALFEPLYVKQPVYARSDSEKKSIR